MTKAEYEELEKQIIHKVRGIVDVHPLTKHLSDVARRNMANSAGWSALSALTPKEIEQAVRQ
jgi:hypothetical protein